MTPFSLRADYVYYSDSTGAYITGYNGPAGHVIVPSTLGGRPVVAVQSKGFSRRSDITAITLPEGLTILASDALEACGGLSAIHLPSTLQDFNPYWFKDCDQVADITFSPTETRYVWETGVILNTARTKIIFYPPTRPGASYTAPAGILTVGFSAFTNARHLESVTLPPGTTTLEGFAFSRVPQLKVVNLPSSLRSIGGFTFADSVKLTTVAIPSGVTSIAGGAFFSCESLLSINWPVGVTIIGESTFSGCVSLTTITLPSSIQSIRESAFYGCSSLVLTSLPAGLIFIADYAFANCASLVNITLPSSLMQIGIYAFSGCAKLQTVSVPASVVLIGFSAFLNCPALLAINVVNNNQFFSSANGVFFNKDKTVLIVYPSAKVGAYQVPASVRLIPRDSFYKANGLTSVIIPGTVDTVSSLAFSQCENLSSITLGNGLRVLDGAAFTGCTALTSIHIPASVTYFGGGVFSGCTNLTQITVAAANPVITAVDNVVLTKDGHGLLQYPCGRPGAFTTPAGVTYLSYSQRCPGFNINLA